MPAQIAASIVAVPEPLPIINAKIGETIRLTNNDGWTGVDSVQWTMFPWGNSAASLVPVGNDRDLTPDVPGAYLIHLKINYTGGAVSTDRAFIGVPEPAWGGQKLTGPASYERGADPDADAPLPTRDTTYGYSRDMQRILERVAQNLLVGNNVIPLVNSDPLLVSRGTVVSTGTPQTYKGWPDDPGSSPAISKRKYLQVLASAGAGSAYNVVENKPLLILLEDIDADDIGMALMEGYYSGFDTTGAAPGDPVYVDDTGQLTLTSPDDLSGYVARQVGFVTHVATDTADPPGTIYFSGKPRWMARSAGGYPLSLTAGGDASIGTPTAQQAMETSPNPLYRWRATANANGDQWVNWHAGAARTWMLQWPNVNALMRFWYRMSRPESGTQIKLTIYNGRGDTLYDSVLPTPGAADTWVEKTITWGDVQVAGIAADYDPLMAGELLYFKVEATFGGAGAVNGDTIDWQEPEMGLPAPVGEHWHQ